MNPLFERWSSEILLFCGLLTMIAVSIQSDVVVRCAQMAFFMTFAAIMGRRVRLLPPAVMLLSVVIANLFSPNGRVLLSLWRFDVTSGAVRLGFLKGSLLIGLIYVSRISVGPGLRIPGRFGALFLKTFAYFEELSEKWPETRGDLLARIDDLLERMAIHGVDGTTAEPGGGSHQTGTRRIRRNLVAAVVLLAAGWGPFIATSVAA